MIIFYPLCFVSGNGPSAICLSYFLSGYRPYYNGTPVANPYLNEKLQKIKPNQSIVEMVGIITRKSEKKRFYKNSRLIIMFQKASCFIIIFIYGTKTHKKKMHISCIVIAQSISITVFPNSDKYIFCVYDL